MSAVELNRANLSRLRPPVRAPRFDPAAVRPGVVHLGLGNFHRAHMARYTHDLVERRPDALQYGIVGAGLLPADRRMRDSLAPHDGLYTLVERSGGEETVSVIGSLAGVAFAGESPAGLLDAIHGPGIGIVSLTVTESGYCLNRSTKRLDPEHPPVRQDLQVGAAAPGQSVTLGVRPESLRPDANGPLYGEVRLPERLGGLTLLHVTLAGGQTVVVQIGGSDPTRAHEPIRLSVDGAACHVFDAEGRALPALKRNALAA